MEKSIDYKIEFEKAIYNLLWVWDQYNSWGSSNGNFTHACMSSGENASAFLERHGYGVDEGYCFRINQKAKNIMENSNLEE